MSARLPLYLHSPLERARARDHLVACTKLAADAIVLVAMRERRCERLADCLRREREALMLDRAQADEAEKLLARAVGELVRTHAPSRAVTRRHAEGPTEPERAP